LALSSKEALDVCESDAYLDINEFWIKQELLIDDPAVDDLSMPSDPQDVGGEQQLDGETTGQNGLGADNDQATEIVPEESEEVAGDEDLAIDDIIHDDEDIFDFTDVEVISPPKDSHHEEPEREPVPTAGDSLNTDDLLDLDPETTTTAEPEQISGSAASQSLQPTTTSKNSSGGGGSVAIYVVISAVIVGFLGFVILRRRRSSIQRKQKEFQTMYQDAERSVIESHKNTNYRDHSQVSSSSSYRDEGTIVYSNGAEDDGRDGFVLDAKMLNRMN
jgi:hypothetical protein